MNEPIALIDMDGTVADFDKSMKLWLNLIRGPGEDPQLDDTAYEELEHMKYRRRLIKAMPGFWANLSRIESGFEIIGVLRALNYKLHVLTKGPAKSVGAYSEKVQWCREHLPDVPVTISDDKGLVYGRVLVDDWPVYIKRWREWRPRGYVVAVAQPWNVGIDELPNVMRYDRNEEGALDQLTEFLMDAKHNGGSK